MHCFWLSSVLIGSIVSPLQTYDDDDDEEAGLSDQEHESSGLHSVSFLTFFNASILDVIPLTLIKIRPQAHRLQNSDQGKCNQIATPDHANNRQ
jgi:hypothetical protein